jgi:hypoxanthine phosphoribosyltransferase
MNPQCTIELNWDNFQHSVNILGAMIKAVFKHDLSEQKIYGPPRGGTVMAVALSHILEIPMVLTPEEATIWVDDIVETGKQLKDDLARNPNLTCCSWVEKESMEPPLSCSVIRLPMDAWIVFPWELSENSDKDANIYYRSRQKVLDKE